MKLFYLLLLSFLLPLELLGQRNPFYNPSFEGGYVGFTPIGWGDCAESESSINTQPGWSEVTLPASNGNNYLGMVTRGGTCKTCHESALTWLKYPITADSCYTFDLDLAHSVYGYPGYSAKTILRIWGVLENAQTNELCGQHELLWTSPKLQGDYWQTYPVSLNPSESYRLLSFEVFYEDIQYPYSGNILVDNIHNFRTEGKPKVELGKDTTVCSSQDFALAIQLDANAPAPKIAWNTGETSPQIQVNQSGLYKVTVENACGVLTDSVYITLKGCVEIPNVFTPNQDGHNETFFIEGIQKGNWQLQVYDRKGSLVYKNQAYQNDWNGNGLPNAVYYYYLINLESKEKYKGWVEIMR